MDCSSEYTSIPETDSNHNVIPRNSSSYEEHYRDLIIPERYGEDCEHEDDSSAIFRSGAQGHSYLILIALMRENMTRFFDQILQFGDERCDYQREVASLTMENTKLRDYATNLYIMNSKLRAKLEDAGRKSNTEKSDNSLETCLHVASTDIPPASGFTLRIEIVTKNGTEQPLESPDTPANQFTMQIPSAPEPSTMSDNLQSASKLESSSSSTISAYDSHRSSRKNSHVRLCLDDNVRVPERTNSPHIHPAQQLSAKYEIGTSDSERRQFSASEATLTLSDDNSFMAHVSPGISASGIVRQCPRELEPKQTKSSKQFHLKGILSRGGLSKSDRDEKESKPKAKKASRKSKAAPKPPSKRRDSSKHLNQDWSDIEDGSDQEF